MGIMQFMDRAAPLALDPAITLLGNEPQGAAFDFAAMRGFIRDRVTGANNWLGDPNNKLTYASPSPKWITNAHGVLVSGTTLRCDHDPASLDSSTTSLNSMGIGVGAVVNKSIVLASGAFTYPVGEVVRVTDATDITKWILGRVVSWTAGTKTLVIAGYAASAPYVSGSSWKVIVALGIRIESQRTNLTPQSQHNTGFTGQGASPPTVTSSVDHLGESATRVVFTTGATVGYAGSRAVKGGLAATVAPGIRYAVSNLLSLNRPLVGSERLAYYWTGVSGIGGFEIDATNSMRFVGKWVRIETSGIQGASTAGTVSPAIYHSNNSVGLLSDIEIYICKGQCEEGAFSTSYIETTTAQVTRAADRVNLAVALFPFSSVVSVLSQEIMAFPGTVAGDTVGVWSGTNANALSGYQQGSPGGVFVATARSGGVGYPTVLGALPVGVFSKTTVRYEVGNAAGVRSGGSLTAMVIPTMPTDLTFLTIGSQNISTSPAFWLKSLSHIPRSPSNAELQGLIA